MVQINFAKGEVQCKIVYYGPAGSGKTANLRAIKERTPDHVVGDLTTIATDGESTLFFDFLPLDLGNLSGIQTKIHLYAAPWQRNQTAVRMLVLQGADGIVFVADRSRERLDDNKAALQDLHNNLRALGRDFSDLPVVFQWNKSDVEDAMSVQDLRMELGVSENADSEAVALKGEGVFHALKSITASVLHEAGAVAKHGTSVLRKPSQAPAREPELAQATVTPLQQPAPVPAPPLAPTPEFEVPVAPTPEAPGAALEFETPVAPAAETPAPAAELEAPVAPAPEFEAPTPPPVSEPALEPVPAQAPEVSQDAEPADVREELPETPVYEDDIDAAPVQMPSWRQEDDSGPQVVPLSDPTVQIPEEELPPGPLDPPAAVSPEFETLKELSPDVGPVAPPSEPSGSGGSRLVRVGPPPNVPTASAPITGPLGAGGGWGGTHGEAARPAHHLPAPAPQRTPQARASASRCVLGAILMILWLAATGYLVHLM